MLTSYADGIMMFDTYNEKKNCVYLDGIAYEFDEWITLHKEIPYFI